MIRVVALVLMAALPAGAAPYRYLDESQTTTGCKANCSGGTCNRPVIFTTLPTEGLDLTGVYGLRVTICADSGFNVLGASNLDVWTYSPSVGGWAQNGDANIYVGNCTSRCCTILERHFVAREVGARLLVAANTVNVSGGSCLRMIYIASMEAEGKR